MTVSNFMEQAVEAVKSHSVARVALRSLSSSRRALIAQRASLYKTYAAPGEMVFDIGVADGLQSELFLACHLNVIGVEPNPNFRSSITRKFGRDPRFEFVAKKLGARIGLAEVDETSNGSVGGGHELRQRLMENTGASARKWVEVTTLDAIINQFGCPRVCKINTEGSEPEILSGLSQPIPFVVFALNSNQPEALRACVNRLSAMSPVKLNVNCAGSEQMHFQKWSSPSTFLNMIEDGTLPLRADCWVAVNEKTILFD